MIINGYDTLIGKPLKVKDHVEEIIKTLALRRDLLPTTKAGVFTITNSNDTGLPRFPLPITFKGYDNTTQTVYDERQFRNTKDKVVNDTELNIIRLTAYMQQDYAMGQTSTLNSSKFICVKGVGGALAQLLSTRYGLDTNEALTLRIVLGHYVNCVFEPDSDEHSFVSSNAIKSAFGINRDTSQMIIDDIGYLKDVVALVNAIKEEPTLFKLKNLFLADFIAMTSRLTYIGVGGKVVSVMLESPFLMCGFIYAAVTNKAYNKTALGLQLDPKYNRDLVDDFIRNISYNYDLSPVI